MKNKSGGEEGVRPKIAKLAPRDAKTFKQCCALISECYNTRRSYFLLTHAGLIISNHISGQQSTGTVHLTRGEFEKFVRFYQTGQKSRTGGKQ